MSLIVVTSVGGIDSLTTGVAMFDSTWRVAEPSGFSRSIVANCFIANDLPGRRVYLDFLDLALPNPYFIFSGPLMSTSVGAGGPEEFGALGVIPTLEVMPEWANTTSFGRPFLNDAALPVPWIFDFIDLPEPGDILHLVWGAGVFVPKGADSSVFGDPSLKITDQLKLEEGIAPTSVVSMFRIIGIRPLVFNFVEC